MASSRLELQALLEEIAENVYFQPPSNLLMEYPCIHYVIEGGELKHADNRLYKHTKRYQVTVIDRNPDSPLPDQVIELPLCSFDRFFAADDLNHYVFTLFF
jgi:hypothetical protein